MDPLEPFAQSYVDAHRKTAKPRPTLADRAGNPKSLSFRRLYGAPASRAQLVRSAEKIVLDDSATRLWAEMSSCMPRDAAKRLDLCRLPYDPLWVECNTNVLMRSLQGTMVGRYEDRGDDFKIGYLFTTNESGTVTVAIFETKVDEPRMVAEWPVHFEMNPEGRVERLKAGQVEGDRMGLHKGKMPVLEQTGLLWGYDEKTTGLAQLNGRLRVTIPAALQELPHAKELAQESVTELMGTARRAVTLISLLHSHVIEPSSPRKPKGRFIGAKGTQPYLVRRTAVLSIPQRVTKVRAYAERAIREAHDRIRKRLHKVRGHYRHMDHEPINGDGWVPCTCPEQKEGSWHKFIPQHMRGDESLGVVEHDYTIATG